MLNLILHPVTFFESLKTRHFNLIIPASILILSGFFDGLVSSMIAEGTNLQEIIGGTFPILTVLYLILLSNLSFYLIFTAQLFLFPIIVKKLGGSGGSLKHSFYILGISTLPILIQNIVHLLFPGTVWWQYFEHLTILHLLSYSIFNVFNIWSVALLVIGFAKVYNVTYKKASILYVQFLIKLIPLIIITLIAS